MRESKARSSEREPGNSSPKSESFDEQEAALEGDPSRVDEPRGTFPVPLEHASSGTRRDILLTRTAERNLHPNSWLQLFATDEINFDLTIIVQWTIMLEVIHVGEQRGGGIHDE